MIARLFVLCFVFAIALRHQPTRGAEPPIVSLNFSVDGRFLLSTSQLGVQVFAWPSLKRTRFHRPDFPNVLDASPSPGGKWLAVSGGNPADSGMVELLSWPELKPKRMLEYHSDSVTSVAWLDEQTLVSSGLDHEVAVWSIRESRPSKVLRSHSRGVTSLASIPQHKTIVSAGIDQSLRVWNSEDWKLVRSMNIHTQSVNDIKLKPKSNGLPMLASASDDRSVRFWQPTIGRMVRFVRLETKPLAIDWSGDGQRIFAACTDGRLYVIDPLRVQVISTHDAVDGWAYSVANHPSDGSIAVGGSAGQVVRVVMDPQ